MAIYPDTGGWDNARQAQKDDSDAHRQPSELEILESMPAGSEGQRYNRSYSYI